MGFVHSYVQGQGLLQNGEKDLYRKSPPLDFEEGWYALGAAGRGGRLSSGELCNFTSRFFFHWIACWYNNPVTMAGSLTPADRHMKDSFTTLRSGTSQGLGR